MTRNAVPAASSVSRTSNARSLPIRRDSIGAIGPNKPKHSDGRVVSKLAPVVVSPVARTASSRIGPTLVIGVRSEKAIKARLAANAILRVPARFRAGSGVSLAFIWFLRF
jgi:hypothetical protein